MTRHGWKWGFCLLAILVAAAVVLVAGGFFDGNASAVETPTGWTWD